MHGDHVLNWSQSACLQWRWQHKKASPYWRYHFLIRVNLDVKIFRSDSQKVVINRFVFILNWRATNVIWNYGKVDTYYFFHFLLVHLHMSFTMNRRYRMPANFQSLKKGFKIFDFLYAARTDTSWRIFFAWTWTPRLLVWNNLLFRS